MTIEDGYAIQREWVKLELASGRSIKGRKIGLTSRAMQQASQIDEPDYAPLMDDMFFAADSDMPLERFIAPRVEVELAFILGKPLKGPCHAGSRCWPRPTTLPGNRDHRRPHRAVRPRDQGDAQGVRHHQRFRGQRRHHRWARSRGAVTSTCAGLGAILSKNGVVEETGRPLACSVIPRSASRGSPTRSRRTASS
jgi:hypothetical protein